MGPRTLAETRPLAKKTIPYRVQKGRALIKPIIIIIIIIEDFTICNT
jgi:hypothetical protein